MPFNGDGQFINPTGIAITNNDILYVGDRDNRRIQYFDSNGNYLGKWGSEGTGDGQFLQQHGLAVDAQGHVYVTDSELHRVQKFDVNGAFISKWGTQGTGDGQFRYPFSIEVDNGSGHLYIPDAQNNRIQMFDLEGNYVSQWGSGDGQFNFPNSIAIDNNGHVYVTEANNHQVQKFDGDGHFLNRWSGLVNTIGIVLSPKTGQLNVGGNLSFQLTETFTNGTSQDQTANTTFTVSDPTIATIQNNEFTAISPGTVTVTATYGSTSDTATITVNAVPIPTPTPEPIPEPVYPTEPDALPFIRAQAVKVLNQLFERPALEDITTSTFNDVPSPHWAFGEIEAAATERMVKQ